MKRFLIIPKIDRLEESSALAEKHRLGYEYNDFFMPDVLDDEQRCSGLIETYRSTSLPELCTLHGAFFDVIVFSVDKRIRQISELRVEQSISAAKRIGAGAVVFHTNYNPFLSSADYVEAWLEQNSRYWGKVLEEHSDIGIYFENMFDSSPQIMARLSERLCGYENFGICLDYAHAALTPVPPREWVTALGKYVRHIHINDNDLRSDLHLAVGDGSIVWDEFYSLYETYLNGASILIETGSLENQKRSIARMTSDGFM